MCMVLQMCVKRTYSPRTGFKGLARQDQQAMSVCLVLTHPDVLLFRAHLLIPTCILPLEGGLEGKAFF